MLCSTESMHAALVSSTMAEVAVGRHLRGDVGRSGPMAARCPPRPLPLVRRRCHDDGACRRSLRARAATRAPDRSIAAPAPDRCRLTFRSPPRAQEWISGGNVTSPPLSAEGRLPELSGGWRRVAGRNHAAPDPRRFPGNSATSNGHEMLGHGAPSARGPPERPCHRHLGIRACCHDRGPRDSCYREHFAVWDRWLLPPIRPAPPMPSWRPRAAPTSSRLTFDGMQRDYRLHVPPAASAGQPLPLVLNLHGATQNAQLEEITSDMDPNADQNGYLVAYPDGTRISKVLTPDPIAKNAQYGWNAGRMLRPAGDEAHQRRWLPSQGHMPTSPPRPRWTSGGST